MQGLCDVHLAHATFVVHPGHLGDEPELTICRGSSDAPGRYRHLWEPPMSWLSIVPAQRILMHWRVAQTLRGPHPRGCGLGTDQDRRLIAIGLDRLVVRWAFARFQDLAA